MRVSLRLRAALVAVAATVAFAGLPSTQPAASADPVAASMAAGQRLFGSICRWVGLPPELCATFDGRVIGEASMQAYEASWVHRAHALQRQLDDAAPFTEQLLPHTHNSFNASAYPPSLATIDANQAYSIRDQLRMDIRAIEIDVHWMPSLFANPPGSSMPVACHGNTNEVLPGFVLHVGCSVDQPFDTMLAEVRAWLTANPGEVIVLYLQNELDGLPEAHAAATTMIQQQLGSLVYRPTSTCQNMPMAVSRADIRNAGKQVLLVGNCGPGAWGNWVHVRGPQWKESSSALGDDYPASCQNHADSDFVRRYEDGTWLGAVAGGGSEVTTTEARRMAACGVNMIGFDHLTPEDPRLAAVIWSWAPGHPMAPGCTQSGADGRFRTEDCAVPQRFACSVGWGQWTVTSQTGAWSDGPAACAAEFPGSQFAVPHNGKRNGQLRAAAGSAPVWVNFTAS